VTLKTCIMSNYVIMLISTFYLSNNPEKKASWFPQKYEAAQTDNNNQKCFLSSKSSY